MRKIGRPGITLIELLVTIAIMAVVMSLLIYPISTGYSYIRKAQARTEASTSGNIMLRRLTQEVGNAAYIFDIPADGASVTFVPSISDTTGSDGQVTLVRYAQSLDLPWVNSSNTPGQYNWVLMQPNDILLTSENAGERALAFAARRSGHYAPFHSTPLSNFPRNPYILGRYESPVPQSWADAQRDALDRQFPMSTLDTGNPTGYLPSLMQRQFRNTLVPISPLGRQWDVPRFRVTPVKQTNEALTMGADSRGRKIPTVVSARYPLWAGRNRDFDREDAIWLALNNLSSIDVFNTEINALYPLYPRLSNGGGKSNPFGYQVLIYEKEMPGGEGLVYGTGNDGSFWVRRHYMEWPPINRADWNAALPYWTAEDITRQRQEGKLVFSQPFTATALTALTDVNYTTPDGEARTITSAVLPIPSPQVTLPEVPATPQPVGWDARITYLASQLPTKLTVNGVTFTHVDKAWNALDPSKNEYTYREYRALNWASPNWQVDSRTLYFSKVLTSGALENPITYLVCDLQPTDKVIMTYSTRAALDIEVTLAREDRVGRSPEERRQDYHAKRRVVAQNAIHTARRSR